MRMNSIPRRAQEPKSRRKAAAWLRLVAMCIGLALLVRPGSTAASLACASRILVIAPHPDDETLGQED